MWVTNSNTMDRTIEESRSVAIGELLLVEVSYAERRARTHPFLAFETRAPEFHLRLQLEGQSTLRQDGREAALQPGEFTMCDARRPWELDLEGAGRTLVLVIRENMMRRHLARPELGVALRMEAQTGASLLLSRLLRDLWNEYRTDPNDPAIVRIGSAFLSLIATVYSALPQPRLDRTSLAMAHRVRILDWIETHLYDDKLAPAAIATACGMTQRYLHYLFSGHEETVTRYILRRRLEACRRALQSPAHRGRTLASIALSHGFASATHFGRVFRAQYGQTPRAFRRAAFTEGASTTPVHGANLAPAVHAAAIEAVQAAV
jgi:AraC-like DNA-binding protein